MKLNYCILFCISFIIAQSKEENRIAPCVNRLECKIVDGFQNIQNNPNFKQCDNITEDAAKVTCAYKLMGLSDKQADVLFKLLPAYGKCTESSNPQMMECLKKCTNNQSCRESCAIKGHEISNDCFAKQLDIKGFDSKKAVQCSKECNQDTIAEVYDCDYKCREPFYKKFESGTQDIKSRNSTDSKSNGDKTFTTSASTQENSKDSKPTSGSNTASTQQSNEFSNPPASLFSVISFPILFSLFF